MTKVLGFLPLLGAVLFSFQVNAQMAFDGGGVNGGYVRPGASTTTCSTTIQGAIRFNTTSKALEFCNGTAWTAAAQVQGTAPPTAPAGSGYFVMSRGTWNGDLGNISGANAKCLSDLTTNTSWLGYSTANSNGQLIASKVRALLCDSSCNTFMPLTTYYFANANAGSGSAGGASFTTDSSGNGPNESSNWSAANRFSGTYSYWSNYASGSNTIIAPSPQNEGDASCRGFTFSDVGGSSVIGQSGWSDDRRWNGFYATGALTTSTCNIQRNLVCIVNP